MEDKNRNMNDPYNRDNDRDRNWNDMQNDWNRQQNSGSGTYGNVYNRNEGMQDDYDRNWNDRNNDFRSNRNWNDHSSQRSNVRNENRYNQDNDWNRNQRGSSSAGMYGSDYGRRGAGEMSSGFGYGMSFDDRNDNWYGSSQGSGQPFTNDRNRYISNRMDNRSENRYGGDTRNHGNANQGGWDRDWWDRTRDEVSSWFGDSDAERRRRADRIQAGQHRGKGPKGYSRSDERVLEDVCSRLSDDDYVDATNIEVKVESGQVMLTGTVNDREQKRRAEDVVERISGVRDVENHIKVRRDDDSRNSW